LQGDSKYINIAAASILAKCARDAMVCESVIAHPELDLAKYGFISHKGYGTPAHLKALKTYGVTQFHRKTFAPVAALINN
jgi:ribonuclease HII